MHERWLSVEEIAAHLDFNPQASCKWIEGKKMPAHNLGRLWKFHASELNEWIKSGHAAKDGATTASRVAAKRTVPLY